MNAVAWTVKTFLIPGSLPFLLLAIVGGALMASRGARPGIWARRWLLGVTASYWLLGVPLVADSLVGLVGYGYHPISTAEQGQGATAIVVLDGGTERYRARGGAIDHVNGPTALRALEAIRVYRLLGNPLVIVTSGSHSPQSPSSPEGAALRDELVRGGVPAERVLLDSASPNTRAHAINVGSMLRTRGIGRAVLVTSPAHIRRADWAFRGAGVRFLPSPPAGRSEGRRSWEWWPAPETLQASAEALQDLVGLAYYWARGWLG